MLFLNFKHVVKFHIIAVCIDEDSGGGNDLYPAVTVRIADRREFGSCRELAEAGGGCAVSGAQMGGVGEFAVDKINCRNVHFEVRWSIDLVPRTILFNDIESVFAIEDSDPRRFHRRFQTYIESVSLDFGIAVFFGGSAGNSKNRTENSCKQGNFFHHFTSFRLEKALSRRYFLIRTSFNIFLYMT